MNESSGLESVHFDEDRPVPSTPRALWLLFSRTPEQVTSADADAAEQLASALVPYALESVHAVLAIPDRGEATEEAPDFGHEFGMIVLADRRDWRGFDALLRLLYRSTAWLETVFPSFLVGDGSAIVASFAMGDADRLLELQRLLSDASRPMAYRHLCGSALSKLTFHGALSKEELRKIYDAAWDANPGRQFVRFAIDPLALSMLGVDWLLGRAARDQVTIDEETLEELRATIRTTQEEHAEKPWLFGPLEKLSDALLRAAFYLDDHVDFEDNEDDEVLDGDGKDYEPLWGAAEDDAESEGEDAHSSGDELDHEGCGHEDCDHDHDEPEEVPGFPFVRESPKVGRNDPCPCGSSKKFKKCCG